MITKKCPYGFNEASHIGYTNYATMILWLTLLPMYFYSNDYSQKPSILAISLSLSGWIELVCLYIPKVYFLLFRSKMNTDEFVIASTTVKFVH